MDQPNENRGTTICRLTLSEASDGGSSLESAATSFMTSTWILATGMQEGNRPSNQHSLDREDPGERTSSKNTIERYHVRQCASSGKRGIKTIHGFQTNPQSGGTRDILG